MDEQPVQPKPVPPDAARDGAAAGSALVLYRGAAPTAGTRPIAATTTTPAPPPESPPGSPPAKTNTNTVPTRTPISPAKTGSRRGGIKPSVKILGVTANSPPPPPPPGPGYEVVDSPNGPGSPGDGDNREFNVNIVSPLPLPVHVVAWSVGGGGGPGGGVGHPNRPGSEQDTPLDRAPHEKLPLTAQEQFEGVFGGGYVGGYPIHNLGNLATRMKGVGGELKNKFTGIGSRFKSWLDGKPGPGGMTAGQRRKMLRAGKEAWRKARKVGSSVFQAEEARKAAMAGVRGTSGATGAVTGAEGLAAGGARAAAALGPVGAVAAGVAALGVAAFRATQEIYAFARAQEQEVRRLGEAGGGQQAAAIAILDYHRTERDLDMAQKTGASAETLTEGINAFEQALQPIQIVGTEIANVLGGTLLELVTKVVELIGPAAETVIDFIKWWRGEAARNRPETQWQAYKRFAEEGMKADAPQWPEATNRPASAP